MTKKLTNKSRTLKDMEVLRPPFRNFNGNPTKFNPEGGRRFFNVRLDEDLAKEMAAEGWNVKELAPLEEGNEPLWMVEVKINFGGIRPPKIVVVSPSGKKKITKDNVGEIDSADIEFADVIINPHDWGGETVTAYLETGYFNIRLDELELKYAMEDEDEVICDDDGICYIGGVRIN